MMGFLLAKCQDIFFAMLSWLSMISTACWWDVGAPPARTASASRQDLRGRSTGPRVRYSIYAFSAVLAAIFAAGMHRYLNSHLGRLAGAIRDNELRVEYMGASVRRVIHLKYVISAALAGVGGALMAATIGHVDPETTANWTTSGEFVFIAILSGTGSVAPFLGAGIFGRYGLRVSTFNTWQMTLGITMLLTAFLPGGLWSVFGLRRRSA
jgi:branched-chain amino acid transport system permease protein